MTAPKTPDPKADPGTDPMKTKTDGDPPGHDDIVSTVRQVLSEMFAGGDLDVSDDKDGKGDPKAGTARRTLRDEEDDAEAAVRKVMARLDAEKTHVAEHAKIKAETERAPVTVPRRTKWMW